MTRQEENAALALDRDVLLAELYQELRRSAARLMRRDAPFLTIQPTDLVNEAALRIMRIEHMTWQDRQHFFATGSRILRQAMIDAIRSRRRMKRQAPSTLFTQVDGGPALDVELLNDALTRLEAVSADLAQVVELRFFVGLGVEEIATVTGLSPRTVKRRWQTAKLWLASELGTA